VQTISGDEIKGCSRHLEKLERNRILCVWTVQREGGDTWMGGQRLKKSFMGVDSRDESAGSGRVLPGSSEECVARNVDECHAMRESNAYAGNRRTLL
jgi:hypothetical protein